MCDSSVEGFARAAEYTGISRKSDLPVSRGRYQYYPLALMTGSGPYYNNTDFGVLTVLAQDSVGGLEIKG